MAANDSFAQGRVQVQDFMSPSAQPQSPVARDFAAEAEAAFNPQEAQVDTNLIDPRKAVATKSTITPKEEPLWRKFATFLTVPVPEPRSRSYLASARRLKPAVEKGSAQNVTPPRQQGRPRPEPIVIPAPQTEMRQQGVPQRPDRAGQSTGLRPLATPALRAGTNQRPRDQQPRNVPAKQEKELPPLPKSTLSAITTFLTPPSRSQSREQTAYNPDPRVQPKVETSLSPAMQGMLNVQAREISRLRAQIAHLEREVSHLRNEMVISRKPAYNIAYYPDHTHAPKTSHIDIREIPTFDELLNFNPPVPSPTAVPSPVRKEAKPDPLSFKPKNHEQGLYFASGANPSGAPSGSLPSSVPLNQEKKEIINALPIVTGGKGKGKAPLEYSSTSELGDFLNNNQRPGAGTFVPGEARHSQTFPKGLDVKKVNLDLSNLNTEKSQQSSPYPNNAYAATKSSVVLPIIGGEHPTPSAPVKQDDVAKRPESVSSEYSMDGAQKNVAPDPLGVKNPGVNNIQRPQQPESLMEENSRALAQQEQDSANLQKAKENGRTLVTPGNNYVNGSTSISQFSASTDTSSQPEKDGKQNKLNWFSRKFSKMLSKNTEPPPQPRITTSMIRRVDNFPTQSSLGGSSESVEPPKIEQQTDKKAVKETVIPQGKIEQALTKCSIEQRQGLQSPAANDLGGKSWNELTRDEQHDINRNTLFRAHRDKYGVRNPAAEQEKQITQDSPPFSGSGKWVATTNGPSSSHVSGSIQRRLLERLDQIEHSHG
ncbi:MAG: hypothetical protein ABW189_05840 [Rickettsiales bacterium]